MSEDAGAGECLLVWDRDDGPWCCRVPLVEPTTAAAVIACGIRRWREQKASSAGRSPGADAAAESVAAQARIGIWGQMVDPSVIVRPGDRVEIYRPLTGDPRQRRRERARRNTVRS